MNVSGSLESSAIARSSLNFQVIVGRVVKYLALSDDRGESFVV